MGFLEVLSPGLLTSVQDLGRPGFEHLGVSPSGAADTVSYRLGNRLLGNPIGAAALEMTLVGPTLRFGSDALIALTGADIGAQLDDQPLSPWQSHRIRAGQILKTAHVRSGCRSYLCVQNGIQVPLLFGSASTHLQSALGGFEGRGLKKGDQIEIKSPASSCEKRIIRQELFQSFLPQERLPVAIRVTDSIHTELFSAEALQAFHATDYTVTDRSNRLGLRLEGTPLPDDDRLSEVLTTGVCLGSIQISPDGQPTLLFVEQQLTGGYPQIACVISADLPRVGQLRPHDRVRFEKVSIEQATSAFRSQEEWLSSDGVFL